MNHPPSEFRRSSRHAVLSLALAFVVVVSLSWWRLPRPHPGLD